MLEDTLLFEYNILTNTPFDIISEPSCIICQNKEVARESAKFFFSDIPSDILMNLMTEKFNMALTTQEIDCHKKHVKPVYDEELKTRAEEDFRLIESDIVKQVNGEDAVESTIRALQARRLMLEKTSDYGKEWINVCQTLHKWVELKFKKEKKIEDGPGVNVSFGDLFSSDNGEKDETTDSGSTETIPQ